MNNKLRRLIQITLNVRYRSPHTHQLPNWARSLFTKLLPWLLGMSRPSDYVYSKEGEGDGRRPVRKAIAIPEESRVQYVFTLSDDFSDTPRSSVPRDETDDHSTNDDPFAKAIKTLVEDAVDEAVYIADIHRQLTVDDAVRL